MVNLRVGLGKSLGLLNWSYLSSFFCKKKVGGLEVPTLTLGPGNRFQLLACNFREVSRPDIGPPMTPTILFSYALLFHTGREKSNVSRSREI